jgi:hypothetical protein
MVQDTGDTSCFTSWNNWWRDNTYHLSGSGNRFAWMNATRSVVEWKGYGHDLDGNFH